MNGKFWLRAWLAASIASTGASQAPSPTDSVSLDPVALVRRAVEHREQEERDHHPLRYILRNKTEHRDTTKEIIETRDGDVARLIALDGKPLDEAANQAEIDRLNNLLDHPELQDKRRRAEVKDDQRVGHLVHMLPDALLYQFNGTVQCGNVPCYRLSFAPNPKFNPPDMSANIFRGVAGEVWIEQGSERMIRIDSHFVADIDFGLGILGKVNKGGTASIDQTDIGNNVCVVSGMHVRMNGKALLFRTFTVRIDEEASHFAEVPPDTDYRKAIQMLLASR